MDIVCAGAGAIVIESCLVPEPALLAALTVNVKVPAVVGVPEIVPELLRANPFGRVPAETAHVTSEADAARVAEYLAPTWPEGREVVVMLTA